MKKTHCQYCGRPVQENCYCEKFAQEEGERFIEDYNNSPETQLGWAQQDLIDSYRREQ